MSTIITRTREAYPFKQPQVVRPTTKLMLVDEDSATIDDSRFAPGYDNQIAARHQGKAPVVFADTHIQVVAPSFGSDAADTRPVE